MRATAKALASVISCGLLAVTAAQASTPQAELQRWEQASGQAGNAARGQVFFGQRFGGEWSCASCHGQPPVRDGKHASTGKKITPLAPAFNAERFIGVGIGFKEIHLRRALGLVRRPPDPRA